MDPRLYNAAKLGNIAALNSLLEEDPLILQKVDLSPSLETPLHVATLAAKTDFVREILVKRPDFGEELNGDGFSPLHIAAAMGIMKIATELLSMESMGSRLCLVQDKWGRTPLHCAAAKGRVEMVGMLLSKCHEAVQEVSDRGETALHLAVKNNQYEVLKVLVEKLDGDGADQIMNAKNCQGNTILQLAMAKDQVKAVKLLKNESKQEENVIEITQQDGQDEEQIESQTDKGKGRATPPSVQQRNQSIKQQVNNLWVDAEGMILVVASLIATVTYQAGLAPPPTIWKEGMKLSHDCIFRNTKIRLNSPVNDCPAGIFYIFMSFNTAGFLSSIILIFLFRRKTCVLILLPTSLISMVVTYITLSSTMSHNLFSSLILYLLTLIIFLCSLFTAKLIQKCSHTRASRRKSC